MQIIDLPDTARIVWATPAGQDPGPSDSPSEQYVLMTREDFVALTVRLLATMTSRCEANGVPWTALAQRLPPRIRRAGCGLTHLPR